MEPEHGVVINVPLEIRESDDGEHLVGTVHPRGQGRNGKTRTLRESMSLTWPAEGIPVRTTHLKGEVGASGSYSSSWWGNQNPPQGHRGNQVGVSGGEEIPFR